MGNENNNIHDIVEHNHKQDDNEQSQEYGNEEQVYFYEKSENIYNEMKYHSQILSRNMTKLPIEIFKKNLLLALIHKSILQQEPKNKEISFTLPDIDKKIWC